MDISDTTWIYLTPPHTLPELAPPGSLAYMINTNTRRHTHTHADAHTQAQAQVHAHAHTRTHYTHIRNTSSRKIVMHV